MHRVFAFLMAGLLGLTVAACGSGDDHNSADVQFLQGMIPHHRQAIEMAQMASSQASTAEVKDLAARIEQAQEPEIETMSALLAEWGEDVPRDSEMGDMDSGSMGSMDGMMTDEQMAELMGQSGSGFDQMFLSLMIEHHTGAIQAAQSVQQDGASAEVIELAETIEQSQAEEVAEMEALLE